MDLAHNFIEVRKQRKLKQRRIEPRKLVYRGPYITKAKWRRNGPRTTILPGFTDTESLKGNEVNLAQR